MPPPTRTYRPDFRTIHRNLNAYDREQGTIKMDSIYDIITRIVDDQSLNETDTACLVRKYTLGASVHQPERCFEAIMGAIWPPPSVKYAFIINSAKITDHVSALDPMVETLVEQAPGAQTPGRTDNAKTCKVFHILDSKSTIVIDDDRLVIEKEGHAVSLLGQLCGQLPIAESKLGSYHSTTGNSSDATINTGPSSVSRVGEMPSTSPSTDQDPDIANNATQTPPTSGSPSVGPSNVGLHPLSSGSSAPTPNFVSSHPFIRNIRYFPMPSGRELRRTQGFTELSAPGAQTIVLGPRPPSFTHPLHVGTSTLPPGHPPQSSSPDAFSPFPNISGASSSISSFGATSGITSEIASTSGPQPVVSQSPDSSPNSTKRPRDDQDDEEERTRSTAKLCIEVPSQSSDATAPATPAPTLAASGNCEGSSDIGSPKKRSRDAKEDDEETARPSTRIRQESPAVPPRYPSPTPSDRRTGRIIAPFGTSIRLSPRPSPEANTGSLRASHNKSNPPVNSPPRRKS